MDEPYNIREVAAQFRAVSRRIYRICDFHLS